MKKNLIIILITVMLICVGLSGCTSNNNSEIQNTVQVSVLSTERMHRLRTDYGHIFPKLDGNDFLALEIKVTNIGDNKESTSLGYTSISDTSGNTYRPSPYSYILPDFFDNIDIRSNKYNQGKILFEVPSNCTVLYFYYYDLHNKISFQISEPELDIPIEINTSEEIYNEFKNTIDKIEKVYYNISLELTKQLQNKTNYTLVIYLGGDIVYLCSDYVQDILPLLSIPANYEGARTEFNLSLLHWGQMGIYYIYYGYNQDMNYYNQTITQKKIADEHWVNCTRILGFT